MGGWVLRAVLWLCCGSAHCQCGSADLWRQLVCLGLAARLCCAYYLGLKCSFGTAVLVHAAPACCASTPPPLPSALPRTSGRRVLQKYLQHVVAMLQSAMQLSVQQQNSGDEDLADYNNTLRHGEREGVAAGGGFRENG